MVDPSSPRDPDGAFRRDVDRRVARKRRARSHQHHVWFGLGMFGVVGWSVALPTLLGVAIGVWLDDRAGGHGVSWTLTFLGVGLATGCVLAWQWLRREGHHDE